MRIATVDIETPYITNGSLSLDKIFCIAVKPLDEEPKIFTYVYHKDSDGPLKAAMAIC